MTTTIERPPGQKRFCMPSLGADMQAGTVVEWYVRPGDTVKRGDVVGVVETDKGAVDLEIFQAGVIDQLLVPVGEQVPVGTVLALLRDGAAASVGIAPITVERHRVSPLARKMAADMHVDLSNLTGTGTGRAICRDDVLRAAATVLPRPLVPTVTPEVREVTPVVPKVKPVAPEVTPVVAEFKPVVPEVKPVAPPQAADRVKITERAAAMRRAIAAAMSRSNRDIPHYYLESAIDMQRCLDWLREANLQRSVTDRLLPAVLLLKAVALTVHEVPEVNGFWADDQLQLSEAIHLGVAISLRTGGLFTPAIHDTDALTLDELSAALKDLVQRARAGSLRSSELTDATLTVTNLGDQGVDKVFGVIYPPQVALVGFGAVKERPWAVDGLLGVRPIVIATLAGDHRATDGHRGGLFLAAVDRLLQKPEAL
jgi:pyruvate dehydrogenase E2 component (dihydrolipoamide acetyltransferase)